MALYRTACEVLRGPDDFARLFREVAEDAAAAGAVWIEPHVDTTLHAPRLGDHAELADVFAAAAAAAEDATGVGIGLLMSADRTLDPALAEQQARLAAERTPRYVAFGLANDETKHEAHEFAIAFALAGEAGLLRVPHAGELAGASSVTAALDFLSPDRIGHGVRAVEDPAVVEHLVRDGVCCDVCPTSNLRLGLAPSIREHPIVELLRVGVPVTVNADDPMLFDVDLVHEYALVRDGLGLDDEAMAAIARTSITASAMPAERRDAARAGIDGWLKH
jgi:adenosine deaminase